MSLDDVQRRSDTFYMQHGKCCAGCDNWSTASGFHGECAIGPIVSAESRMRAMGYAYISVPIGSGRAITRRENVCNSFQDSFNWLSLPADYLRRIGFRWRAHLAWCSESEAAKQMHKSKGKTAMQLRKEARERGERLFERAPCRKCGGTTFYTRVGGASGRCVTCHESSMLHPNIPRKKVLLAAVIEFLQNRFGHDSEPVRALTKEFVKN